MIWYRWVSIVVAECRTPFDAPAPAAARRLGTRLSEHDSREVRRLIISSYEVRYEIAHADVTIVRVWHTREDR